MGTSGFKLTVGLLAFARSNTRTLLLTDSASSLALAITLLSSCVSPWRVFKLGLKERDRREQRKGGEEEIRKRERGGGWILYQLVMSVQRCVHTASVGMQPFLYPFESAPLADGPAPCSLLPAKYGKIRSVHEQL